MVHLRQAFIYMIIGRGVASAIEPHDSTFSLGKTEG